MQRKTDQPRAGSSRPLVPGGIVKVLSSIVPFIGKRKPADRTAELERIQQKEEKEWKKNQKKTFAKKSRAQKRAARKAVRAPEASKVARPSATLENHQTEERRDASAVAKGSVRERATARADAVQPVASDASAPSRQADVIDEAEDQWLSKVIRKDAKDAPAPKQGTWSILKGFMSFGGKSAKQDPFLSKTVREKPAAAQETLTHAEIASDPFLKNVTGKDQGAVAAADAASKQDVEDLKKQVEAVTKQEELAKKREEAFQQELERQKKQLAQAKVTAKDEKKAINDVAVTEAAAKQEAVLKPAEEKKKTEQPAVPTVVKKKNLNQKPGGMQQFLASIGHIGLGKERMMFIQNLGTMLGAGLSLVESLHTLQRETRAKPMRKIIQNVIDNVENGYPLWKAMDAQSFFTPHAIALVRIGEEAGNLAENVVYLAQQEEKDAALKGKVKMAMIYPTIVMVLMFIIVVGLGMFVLPQLLGVLTSLDVPLPLATRMIILFTNMFTEHGAVFVPSMIGAFFVLSILSKYTNFKVVTQWVMFHIPGIGALAREATIARFGVILGGLLKAGVPVVEAMQSLVTVTPIVRYKKLYQKMLDHIQVGDSFAKSFTLIKKSEKLLPPSVQQLVITGERSGALADITLKIADIYDKKASDTAQKLPVILEPMLLLFIGGLVGTIAFAIIVPIYSIVGNVGGQ
jgi:type IV pilus assembly protein PilC